MNDWEDPSSSDDLKMSVSSHDSLAEGSLQPDPFDFY
jgi:hypothetical protein